MSHASLKARLRAVLASGFPTGADILEIGSHGDFVLRVSWPLDNPGRRSRPLVLTIAKEAVDNYVNATEALRQVVDARLAKAIRDKVKDLDPNPTESEPGVVHWLLGSLLFG